MVGDTVFTYAGPLKGMHVLMGHITYELFRLIMHFSKVGSSTKGKIVSSKKQNEKKRDQKNRK